MLKCVATKTNFHTIVGMNHEISTWSFFLNEFWENLAISPLMTKTNQNERVSVTAQMTFFSFWSLRLCFKSWQFLEPCQQKWDPYQPKKKSWKKNVPIFLNLLRLLSGFSSGNGFLLKISWKKTHRKPLPSDPSDPSPSPSSLPWWQIRIQDLPFWLELRLAWKQREEKWSKRLGCEKTQRFSTWEIFVFWEDLMFFPNSRMLWGLWAI